MNKLKEDLDGRPLWDLPHRISNELVETYEIIPVRWIGQWLYISIMLGGFIFGAFFWAWCNSILTKNAIEAAALVNGYAYDTNFGIGLLIGLFVWILISVVISLVIIRISPMPYKGTLFLMSQMDGRKQSVETLPKKPKLNLSVKPHSTGEMINNHLNTAISKWLLYLSPFIILTGFITQAELTKFTIISPTGLHTSGWTSNTMTVDAWQDVETVKLGCNQTDDGSSLIYEVTWSDGKNKRLPTDTHINDKDWLLNLETIDAKISQNGADFRRWQWLNRNALHPKCMRGFYAELGETGKSRFDKLMRVGEFE